MQTGSIYGKKIIRSYKPRRKKFEQQVEEYLKINQSFFCEVLRDVVYESIDANLLNRLPVFMFHRLYRKSKKGIIIHYEGEYNNIWFQCIFAEEGLMLMFDSFVPDNKYSPDGYIDYNNFTSKVKMYEFIIEAFEHYHDRVSKKDFDSIEVLNEYINKQKEVK